MVMLAEINISSRNGGSGVIIARIMPSTAIGTANSRQFTAVAADPAPGRAALGGPGGRLRAIGTRALAATYLRLGFMSLKIYASTSATARYKCGGISWPTSADLYKACAKGWFSTMGTS